MERSEKIMDSCKHPPLPWGRLFTRVIAGGGEYWLTRFVFLRLLGLVYLVAFLSLVNQVLPLIGSSGLLPAKHFLARFGVRFASRWEAFLACPSLFWIDSSDGVLVTMACAGVALSAVVLSGFANSLVMAAIWLLYLSFVNIGQVWYGYGWEIQLLETGFLAIFICPFLDARPFPRSPPPLPVIWLLRWLTLRVMLGAGLIKIRGNTCWRDLTCLYYHYETQPIPNPLSRWIHHLPTWFHQLGVLYNHLAELVAPLLVFGPRVWRHVAGMVMVIFQFLLMLSGNLSFLNWLTIAAFVGCFDDRFLRRILPRRIVAAAQQAAEHGRTASTQQVVSWLLVVLVAWLSIGPVRNLLARRQVMNRSFDRLHLVNTYGAFGSVGKVRYEIILEGTREKLITPDTVWQEYEFRAKPGDPYKTPPLISPYHYRIDWQIWFAAMSTPERHPWMVHLIWKLLHNDPGAVNLIAKNPFPEEPPRYIRAELFHYEFTELGDPSGAVWKRTRIQPWLKPLAADDRQLQHALRVNGWLP